MLSFWNSTRKNRPTARSRGRLHEARLRVEELESRNLPTLITPFSLAQSLQFGFTGYTPAQIQQAYGFSQLTAAKPGLGETIAIVDAYESPNIRTDLTTFDTQYSLPAINLTVVNDGATTQDPTGGWELVTALDVEWSHAIAPYANVVLVEAANDHVNSAGVPTALIHSVTVAATQPGVNVVSMSWGTAEFATETQYDSTFNVPGITFVAASGDNGEPPIWPAISPNVVAVGGTTLESTSTSGVYIETGWGDGLLSVFQGSSGGGISSYEPGPAYQADTSNQYVTSVTSALNPNNMRMNPDVAYDADPNTGIAVYDASNGGWLVVGGTGAGTPQFAALVALADQVRAGATTPQPSLSSSQTLTALYQEQADFYDITSGNNGFAAAGIGYDLVTGLGSPQANLLVPALAAQSSATGLSTSDPLRTAAPGSNQTGPTTTDFTVTGTNIQAVSGQAFTGTIATIAGAPAGTTAASFTATIHWGDGTTSTGTVTVDPSGGIDVTGTHTYTDLNSGFPNLLGGLGLGGFLERLFFGFGGGTGNETFRIRVVVTNSGSPGYALGYSMATVSPGTPIVFSSTSSANALFVTQLYESLLGRIPDASGLAAWTALLNLGVSRSSVVMLIEQSTEYITDEVQAIYEELLQRQADPVGLAGFTSLLENGGTVEQVEEAIAGSTEYFETRGGGTASGLLNALYTDGLDRAPDAGGLALFEQELSQGVSRQSVATSIFGSTEYRQDQVESYYESYLGRPADPAGLASFVLALGDGITDQGAVAAIIGSQEYFENL